MTPEARFVVFVIWMLLDDKVIITNHLFVPVDGNCNHIHHNSQ